MTTNVMMHPKLPQYNTSCEGVDKTENQLQCEV